MTRFQKMVSSISILSALSLATGGLALAAPDAATGAAETHEGHHGRGHHAGGDLVHAALRLPSLRGDQRAQIQQLIEQEKAAHVGIRAARADLMLAVAQGVEAGRVDDAALKPKVDAVAQAAAAGEPMERAALEKLHGILDAAQRVELVNAIEAHRQAAARGGEPAGNGDRAERRGHGGGAGPLARGLDLSPQQKDQIRANMKAGHDASAATGGGRQAHEAARAQHAKVLEAFKGDRFVMNEVAPLVPEAGRARGPQKMIDAVKASLPVLTPQQRATAAAKLRAEAQRATQK
jgi:Spy/CpxP family protein refolding chaperone